MSWTKPLLTLTVLITLILAERALPQTDGPAQLPLRAPLTAILSPNPPKTVGPTDNLQAALNTAVAGDLFLVDPTNTATGQITLPNLGPTCDPSNGITIRTSGTLNETATHRIIPGQPMPKIIVRGSQAVAGGTCILLYGIEITRLPGTGTIYNLFQPNTGAHDILLDHVYIHGTATDETVRGMYTGGGVKNLTVENSYFADFHCKALGTCGDSQAINCGIGDAPDSGNYLFQNNYLEAATENFICGGGGDQFTPTDVTLQDNDIVKPSRWNPLSPDYAGIPWIVKNFVEFKNCIRCLVQRNRLIGDWGGYSQLGYGFLVTAKNQNGNCPVCTVTDITIRQNWMSTSGQFAQVAFVPAGTGQFAKEQARISIHDNIADGLQYPECSQCGQWLIQLSTSPGAPSVMHDVLISHNTLNLANRWKRDGGFLAIGGPAVEPKMYNINVNDNVFPGGKYPIYSVGGGAANCATGSILDYVGALGRCWEGTSSFTGNTVLINGNTNKLIWPAGNFIVQSGANVLATGVITAATPAPAAPAQHAAAPVHKH